MSNLSLVGALAALGEEGSMLIWENILFKIEFISTDLRKITETPSFGLFSDLSTVAVTSTNRLFQAQIQIARIHIVGCFSRQMSMKPICSLVENWW